MGGEEGALNSENTNESISMDQMLAMMRLALRVLSAINDGKKPTAIDMHRLETLAPESASLSPDELAYDVIQLAIKKRSTAHGR